jgi:hypothetical protein
VDYRIAPDAMGEQVVVLRDVVNKAPTFLFDPRPEPLLSYFGCDSLNDPLCTKIERIKGQKSKKPSFLISELQRGYIDGKPLSLKTLEKHRKVLI